jgi:DNA-binding CsgD family transcriptional regulator
MYLTSYQANVLSRVMATLAEPHDEREIRLRTGRLMLELLDAQYYASYVWDEQRQRFDAGICINMDPGNLARYERHFQYHDPITFELQRHRTATRVTDVMAPSQLRRTAFYNEFLVRDGLHWGMNLYAWNGTCNIGDMRIWRDRHHGDFTRADVELLDLVRPAFVAALARAPGRAAQPDDAPAAHDAGPPVSAEATTGAQQLLSARERAVAKLAAQALSDKDIARQLDVSVTTVRTHLDRAFRKLGVASRMAMARRLGW